MSTLVEATLPVDQFALAETLRQRPQTTFETVRVVVDGTDHVMPFIWARGDDLDGLQTVLESDPSTRHVDVQTTFDGEALVRIEWMHRVSILCQDIVEEDGTIIDARCADDAWTFRILFSEHDSITATHAFCEEYNLEVDFERTYELSRSFYPGRFGLTESQYETIRTAYDQGYYAVPRETTLAELATELGVSHQALSECLRRAHATLVERALRPELAAPFPSTGKATSD